MYFYFVILCRCVVNVGSNVQKMHKDYYMRFKVELYKVECFTLHVTHTTYYYQNTKVESNQL